MKKEVLSDWYEKLVFWRRMLFDIAAVAPVVPQPGATIYINICAISQSVTRLLSVHFSMIFGRIEKLS